MVKEDSRSELNSCFPTSIQKKFSGSDFPLHVLHFVIYTCAKREQCKGYSLADQTHPFSFQLHFLHIQFSR